MTQEEKDIAGHYESFIADKSFPCIGAKAALAKQQIKFFIADHIGCPKDDKAILNFIYEFVDEFRVDEPLYSSAVVIFNQHSQMSEQMFDALFWQRVQSLSDLDAVSHNYDARVGRDPKSADFSFSLKQEAFYLIGLHPSSSRPARKFMYPAIVFNPHAQFEQLRAIEKYDGLKHAIRNRDIKLSGSTNPMLADFGESSEVYQYSGIQYDNSWDCPFIARHANQEHHSAT